MPNLDGTGPFGTGYYGRGKGPCGRGAQRRWEHNNQASVLNKEELRGQLQKQKTVIEQRLKELE